MEALKNLLQAFHFSPAAATEVTSCFEMRDLEKRDFFVQEGKVAHELAFLESGLLQYFATSPQGEELTTYLALPGSFVASLHSFFTGEPARENIRALSQARLWVAPKEAVLRLRAELPEFKDFYVHLLEEQICCIDAGRFDFITLTAEARYEKLCAENPQLLQAVPLQLLAAMLGVTPRHLSRLRRKK